MEPWFTPMRIGVPCCFARFTTSRTRSSGRFRSTGMGASTTSSVRSGDSHMTALTYRARVRRFAPGDSIVWRSVDLSERVVSTVWPWTVVRDAPEGIVLYMPPGTVGKQRTGERGGPRDRLMVRWDGGHRDVSWHSTSVVRLYQERDAFSIWIARDAASGA